MNRELDRRLRRLEATAPDPDTTLLGILHVVLAGDFGPDFAAEATCVFEDLGSKASWRVAHLDDLRSRGVADILLTGADRLADLERFRGLVPALVLEAVSAAIGGQRFAAAA